METNNNKEIDVFTFFTGLNNLFISVIAGIKHLLINLLKFFLFIIDSVWKYKFIVIGCVVIVSGYGMYINSNAINVYTNTMLVETNYSSSIQLYRVIDNFNNLTSLSDSITLNEELDNPKINVTSLKSFRVEQYATLNETSKLINEYLLNMDPALKEVITLEEIRQKIKPTEYKKHLITVESTDNSVFDPLQKSIIDAVVNSEYLNRKHKNNISNYNKEKLNNEVTLQQLEELKVLYEYEIRTKADQKRQVLSSSAVMFSPEQDNIDREAPLKVINKIMSIQENSNQIDLNLQENNEIINIVSGFDLIGKVKSVPSIFDYKLGLLIGVIFALILNMIPIIKDLRSKL